MIPIYLPIAAAIGLQWASSYFQAAVAHLTAPIRLFRRLGSEGLLFRQARNRAGPHKRMGWIVDVGHLQAPVGFLDLIGTPPEDGTGGVEDDSFAHTLALHPSLQEGPG